MPLFSLLFRCAEIQILGNFDVAASLIPPNSQRRNLSVCTPDRNEGAEQLPQLRDTIFIQQQSRNGPGQFIERGRLQPRKASRVQGSIDLLSQRLMIAVRQ